MAHHWLVHLGYQRVSLRKGVYVDGHEREDVVKYRNEVFLLLMKKYEAWMTQYRGPALEKSDPVLQEGEKRIITQFHDESCSMRMSSDKQHGELN